MTQPDLLDWRPKGETFNLDRDGARLSALAGRVHGYMQDGREHSLRDIADACAPCSEASVSARLRELKAAGVLNYAKRHVARGLWLYRRIL